MKGLFRTRKFLASAIGSFPFTDARQTCSFITDTYKDDIPFWPQLPKLSFNENMYVQYSEGMPGVVIDSANKTVYIDTGSERYLTELEASYQAYSDERVDYFAISREFAAGFYLMQEYFKKLSPAAVKGQLIGPVSFALSVRDQNQQPIIYNPDAFEIITKVLSMKARWQIRKLKSKNEKAKTIIFIDEPYLVSIGSSFVSLKRENVIAGINALIEAIRAEGGLAGVHCCGNTDWSLILATDLDILSFDAFEFLDNLLLYKDDLSRFLGRGGALAWGIVPTSAEADEKLDVGYLSAKISAALTEKKLVSPYNLITPSCGCGTLQSLERAKRIHQLTVDIARSLSSK